MRRLKEILNRIEGKGYKAYKQLAGCYRFDDFRLSVDHVQGDPYALPSRISIQLDSGQHGLPSALYSTPIRKIALEDFLGRAVASAIKRHVKGNRGTGHSGQIRIATSGQQVLRRNAVLIEGSSIEARLLFALPADGRSVRVADARAMFFEELPALVTEGLVYLGRDRSEIYRHIEQLEDQDYLRQWLAEVRGVAFVADNSLLPRHSGIDDRPLVAGVPFVSPESMRRQVSLPNRGDIGGMLIPRGITLIVGGGFHGKSTLLQALERGIYNHLPGDGRELVVTSAAAVKIRAEDHRAIYRVDISPFIGTLPGNRSTASFTTDNGSGSTSQAANIVEALECGADCLLIDEDTSATNFMIRDQRMQQLVSSEQEPITPLLHRVRELYEKEGVSSIIVTGGSGDYLAVADRVIMLDNYIPCDVSERAAQLAGKPPRTPSKVPLRPARARPFDAERFDSRRVDGKLRIDVREPYLIDYGRHRIDLNRVEQLVDRGQTEAIGRMLDYAVRRYAEHPAGLIGALRRTLRDVEEQGLDILFPWKVGHLALPRLYELAAAANRMRLEG
jgi:predicted ABC-class ATPase